MKVYVDISTKHFRDAAAICNQVDAKLNGISNPNPNTSPASPLMNPQAGFMSGQTSVPFENSGEHQFKPVKPTRPSGSTYVPPKPDSLKSKAVW